MPEALVYLEQFKLSINENGRDVNNTGKAATSQWDLKTVNFFSVINQIKN